MYNSGAQTVYMLDTMAQDSALLNVASQDNCDVQFFEDADIGGFVCDRNAKAGYEWQPIRVHRINRCREGEACLWR